MKNTICMAFILVFSWNTQAEDDFDYEAMKADLAGSSSYFNYGLDKKEKAPTKQIAKTRKREEVKKPADVKFKNLEEQYFDSVNTRMSGNEKVKNQKLKRSR